MADYLFWQRRRRANAAPWHWKFPPAPPPDVVEVAPGRALRPDPGRERRAGYTAYDIPFLPVPPEIAAEELPPGQTVWVIPRRELRAARSAYEIVFLPVGPDAPAGMPEELQRSLLVIPRRERRASYEAYHFENPFPGSGDLPVELRRFLSLYPDYSRRRTASTAYGIPALPIPSELPLLTEELRRSLESRRWGHRPRAGYEAYAISAIPIGPDAAAVAPHALTPTTATIPRAWGLAVLDTDGSATVEITDRGKRKLTPE